MPATWVATREIPLTNLTRFPGNARRGNIPELRRSLRRHGQYRAIVVRDTGDSLVILAGNHTADALREEGHPAARCELITCTDDEARRINLADNRLAELGDYDADALTELLSYLDDDYEGTGWARENVEHLITPPGPPDEDDAVPTQRGDLLELTTVTTGPPRTEVTTGQVWQLGPHHLVIADVYTEWATWVPLLTPGSTFLPYPTPLAPHAPGAARLVLVQPEPYLAGHLLDKWQDVTGIRPVLVTG